MIRHKSFLRQFLGYWGGWALVSLAICGLFAVMDYTSSVSARHLAEEGVDAKATITSLRVTTSTRRLHTRYHFHVGLSFAASGKFIQIQETVSGSFYESLQVGQVIPIRYWSRDPTLLEVQPGGFAGQAKSGFYLALFSAALALFFAGLGFRWAYATRWMLQNGVERQVTVIALVDAPFSSGKHKRYELTWREPTGELAGSRYHPLSDLPDVGEEITILTDPSGRRASIWLRDL